jgi:hypothetical protein
VTKNGSGVLRNVLRTVLHSLWLMLLAAYILILLGSAAIIGLAAAVGRYFSARRELSRILQLIIGTVVGAAITALIDNLLRNGLSVILPYSFQLALRGTPQTVFILMGTVTSLMALAITFHRREHSDI